METTFITIHDLSPEARILYASDSIVDILGYTPDEVLHRSCWDFFHPDELPVAQGLHSRGVKFDKAAVLSYCQLLNRQRQWVCCECCFTVVYDVMVCCTSIYRTGTPSNSRAIEAPIVRRLFSSSPKDPRYHMLSHISAKFTQSERLDSHEPRAALFLNRFTRTLTVMYATAGTQQILGISGEEMKGKSFYYCIQENCLDDAVRCLESAKGNDSIAYLRFWFRDPRIDDPPNQEDTDTGLETETDVSMTDATSEPSDDEISESHDNHSPWERGSLEQDVSSREASLSTSKGTEPGAASAERRTSSATTDAPQSSTMPHQDNPASRSSSGQDSLSVDQTSASIFQGEQQHSGNAVAPMSPLSSAGSPSRSQRDDLGVELEAVVSCTSDGLVVCLRRARPAVPTSVQQPAVHQPTHSSGIFAAPWATHPVFHPPRPNYMYWPIQSAVPQPAAMPGPHSVAYSHQAPPTNGPATQDLFNSIRDTAIFAWALTGINGSLADYARNTAKATGDSLPPDGVPVWEGARDAYGDEYFRNHGLSATRSDSGYNSGYNSTGHMESGSGGGGNGHGRGRDAHSTSASGPASGHLPGPQT